jgi:hypothetical protein
MSPVADCEEVIDLGHSEMPANYALIELALLLDRAVGYNTRISFEHTRMSVASRSNKQTNGVGL